MNNGLYFYKLVSPYSEDSTKNCKLTINEIDSNFLSLKEANIDSVVFDKDSQVLSLTKKDGESLTASLSGITQDLDVKYYSKEGTIKLLYNGKEVAINGIITEDNINIDRSTKIKSDSTLRGWGNSDEPLMLAYVERTGSYKPALKLIDLENGEYLPDDITMLKKGERYVTHEMVGEYGYLYDYTAVLKMNVDLPNGWRIPTKEDWDNMLNAVEPCDANRNHGSAVANNMLGKYAGKILKSDKDWQKVAIEKTTELESENDLFDSVQTDSTIVSSSITYTEYVQNGVDALGFAATAAGYSDGQDISSYFGKRGYYWSTTMIDETDVYVKRFDYNREGVIQTVECPKAYFSIRLVKDFTGANHKGVENINGVDYKTILLPSENADNGYTIWTAENIAFNNVKYRPIEPNRGENLKSKHVYYIQEWTGTEWEKKAVQEGEEIVLLKGIDGSKDTAYRVVDGELVSVAHVIEEKVYEELLPKITLVEEILGSGFTISTPVYKVDENGEYLLDAFGNKIVDYYETSRVTFTDKINEIDEKVGDGFITDTITNHLKSTMQSLASEIAAREELSEKVDQEINDRIEGDINLQDNLDVVKDAVGLNEDGTYKVNTSATYIQDDENITDAINTLDNVMGSIEDRVTVNEENIEDLQNHSINTVQGDNVYDLLNGTLTLETKDPANNIVIKLTSNYGNLADLSELQPEDIL